MSEQYFRNVMYGSDRSGTFKWRRIWAAQLIDCIAANTNIQLDYSQTPILDQNYYRGITSITVQRWLSDSQKDIMLKFFKPLMDVNSGWLIYEIDDNMSDVFIPKFNRGRRAFEGEHVQNNIREMLNAADLVTVTTDYLKEFYHKHYGVPLDNIVALPNMLPKYLFGDRFEPEKKLAQFRANKAKPRIGIVSSLSHYNFEDVREDKNGKAARRTKKEDGSEVWINEDNVEVPEAELTPITDDLDEVVDVVRSTVDDVQWVFFGCCPPKLHDLAEKQKVEVHHGVPIMNYASMLEQLQLQAIVAPIKKMEFNYCKSFIKYMECAAIGVPLFATNSLPYNRVMPEQQLFDGPEDLKDKLLKLKFSSSKIYLDMINRQWIWLNSPVHEGDFVLKNFWMEDNLGVWVSLFRLRQKTLTVSLSHFSEQYEARKKAQSAHAEGKDIIFKTEDGVEILK